MFLDMTSIKKWCISPKVKTNFGKQEKLTVTGHQSGSVVSKRKDNDGMFAANDAKTKRRSTKNDNCWSVQRYTESNPPKCCYRSIISKNSNRSVIQGKISFYKKVNTEINRVCQLDWKWSY